jgi:hypothetical protein
LLRKDGTDDDAASGFQSDTLLRCRVNPWLPTVFVVGKPLCRHFMNITAVIVDF